MKLWTVIALTGAFLLVVAYLAGRGDGKRSVEADNAVATDRQITEREKTDAKIKRLDLPGVCYELGGVWRNGNCE